MLNFKFVIVSLIMLLVAGCTSSSIAVIDDPINANVTGPIDELTGAVYQVDFEHHETHEGDHYFVKTYIVDTGGIGSTEYFGFITPVSDKRIHARVSLTPDVDYVMTIYEGSNITDGIIVSGINNDRDSNNTALLQPVAAPTIVDLGTLIWTARNGGGKNSIGVSPGNNYEIIAASNTTYVFELSKQITQQGIVDIDFWWYEH